MNMVHDLDVVIVNSVNMNLGDFLSNETLRISEEVLIHARRHKYLLDFELFLLKLVGFFSFPSKLFLFLFIVADRDVRLHHQTVLLVTIEVVH